MSVASCPSCGGPVEFRIGSSEVVVCEYCRSVVARTDRGVESYGQVAALVDTGSPLRIGTAGRFEGKQFHLSGRTQMRHQAGGVWDEWYAAFDDGRWGWLAEAQGKFYVTFRDGMSAPLLAKLDLGERVGPYVVNEIGRAELISAEGEIPWKAIPGTTYDYADLSGSDGAFATIDYSEEPPLVFRGRETNLRELGISGEGVETRVDVAALNCSQCGGPLALLAPDQSERIFCPNCGAGHDITQGRLRFFAKTKKKGPQPVLPLGSTGTLDGEAWTIAGFMQRSVKFDIVYYWTEYLLFNRNAGFRWLVHSDDHWSFVRPVAAGEVSEGSKALHWGGKRYRLFQTADARVTHVVGEFYWKVAVGETVETADYVRPPEGFAKEVTKSGAREVNYSHARYLAVEEVERAFGVEGLPRPATVGPMQPYTGANVGPIYALALVALIVIAIVIGVRLPGRQVTSQTFELQPPAEWTSTSTDPSRVWFLEPFELSGKHNVAVSARANVDNAWVYVAADLVDEGSGIAESFELPIEYYHGVDGGEKWSEGDRERDLHLSAPPKGRYSMRIEAQWAAKLASEANPPSLHVVVREGVFRWSHFWLAFFALSIVPLLMLLNRWRFEVNRWKDSDYSPYGTAESSEDDE
jgi:hypothetical protein